MRLLTTTGGLRLKYRITAGAGAVDPDGFERPTSMSSAKVPIRSSSSPAMGNSSARSNILPPRCSALEPDDHDRVSFDANGFKASRARALRAAADAAIEEVEDTGEPFRFQPMNSRERRMLHLFLRDSACRPPAPAKVRAASWCSIPKTTASPRSGPTAVPSVAAGPAANLPPPATNLPLPAPSLHAQLLPPYAYDGGTASPSHLSRAAAVSSRALFHRPAAPCPTPVS